jgi:hypothetical protein
MNLQLQRWRKIEHFYIGENNFYSENALSYWLRCKSKSSWDQIEKKKCENLRPVQRLLPGFWLQASHARPISGPDSSRILLASAVARSDMTCVARLGET